MSIVYNVIRRYTSIAAVIDILKRQELPLLNPESWDDRNDRYFMQLYKEAKSIGGLTVYVQLSARKPTTIGRCSQERLTGPALRSSESHSRRCSTGSTTSVTARSTTFH